MEITDHNQYTSEAGPSLPFGQRRDSARRCPLRQASLSLVRDLPPRQAGLTVRSHTSLYSGGPHGTRQQSEDVLTRRIYCVIALRSLTYKMRTSISDNLYHGFSHTGEGGSR